jgi:hypothetical protein
MHGWIIFAVEAEDTGRADADAGTAPMAESSVDDLRESAQGARSFVVPIFGPLKWLIKTTSLAKPRIRRRLRKYSQRGWLLSSLSWLVLT